MIPIAWRINIYEYNTFHCVSNCSHVKIWEKIIMVVNFCWPHQLVSSRRWHVSQITVLIFNTTKFQGCRYVNILSSGTTVFSNEFNIYSASASFHVNFFGQFFIYITILKYSNYILYEGQTLQVILVVEHMSVCTVRSVFKRHQSPKITTNGLCSSPK